MNASPKDAAKLMDIKVPDIGDFDEVTVIELLVKPDDTIQADQSLITVQSDKASMEILSSQGGLSLLRFQARYGAEQQCERALVAQRWPRGWQCAHCGCKRSFLTRNVSVPRTHLSCCC